VSQENLEVVRRLWQAYADGGLDGLSEFFDEDIDWRAIEGAPDDVGGIRGIDAMRRYMGDWLETFEDITSDPTEALDLGDDRVLAVLRIAGRARLSGVETELSYAVIYTVRDGKVVRGREYVDRSAALKTVGRGE
jgi:ketosteroid isomerase-like protein